MRAYRLSHLSDSALLRNLAALVTRHRGITVALLAHIAEVDARRLYVPAGYPSMFVYCVDALHLSEDAAYKRIQAARAARRFPALFDALADGRLHLTAIGLLSPHLTAGNASELMAAATHRGNAEIREFLARRFPEAAAPAVTSVRPVGVRPNPRPSAVEIDLLQLAPEQVPHAAAAQHAPEQVGPSVPQLAPEQVRSDASAGAAPWSKAAQVTHAQSVELFRLHVTIGKRTRDKLRYAQALLGHAVPSGDVEQVLDRALDAQIEKCQRRKFAAAVTPPFRPRPQSQASSRRRQTPAPVRRAVWERDQGRCTFVGTTGHRCGERKLLEFDHVDPVARGGQATVDRMRLRCRSHNQYEAERTFGAEFMREKRRAVQNPAPEAVAPASVDGGPTPGPGPTMAGTPSP